MTSQGGISLTGDAEGRGQAVNHPLFRPQAHGRQNDYRLPRSQMIRFSTNKNTADAFKKIADQ